MIAYVKFATLLLMSVFYISIGIMHFLKPEIYLQIMPPYLPWHLGLVYLSGFFEVLFGWLILFKNYRYYACMGLILLLIAVFPANIYLAQTNGAAMNVSAAVAWWRLPFQGVFIGLAYWHSKV